LEPVVVMLDIENIIVNVMGIASKTNSRGSSRMIKAIQVGGAAFDKLKLACPLLTYVAVET
jgi:hypothetical protein